jgi:hypothetical protein
MKIPKIDLKKINKKAFFGEPKKALRAALKLLPSFFTAIH